MFNKKWEEQFFVIENMDDHIECIICHNILNRCHHHDIERHYLRNHSSFINIKGVDRTRKMYELQAFIFLNFFDYQNETTHSSTEKPLLKAMPSTAEPAVDANSMSMIKPVTESLTQMDPPKPSSYVEIEALDTSDEIMKPIDDEIVSDVITEKEQTENVAKTEVVDFEEVISIQDGLKAIEDKNTALAHVRILQEYAMLHDNFRAIGLLSEVEAALISPPKNEDFEYS